MPAAKRMEEATGFSSATIHRTLGAQMEKGEFSFGFNEMCPISCDFLIVDEMVFLHGI
jgi:ATP-dependent exoDNAse (exonuclease V) alpha subunit